MFKCENRQKMSGGLRGDRYCRGDREQAAETRHAKILMRRFGRCYRKKIFIL